MIKLRIYADGLKFDVDDEEQFLLINKIAENCVLERKENELSGNPSSIFLFIYVLSTYVSSVFISWQNEIVMV